MNIGESNDYASFEKEIILLLLSRGRVAREDTVGIYDSLLHFANTGKEDIAELVNQVNEEISDTAVKA